MGEHAKHHPTAGSGSDRDYGEELIESCGRLKRQSEALAPILVLLATLAVIIFLFFTE